MPSCVQLLSQTRFYRVRKSWLAQENERLGVINPGFQIFASVSSHPNFQPLGALFGFYIVIEQALLDELDRLRLRVFPFEFPGVTADLLDALADIRVVRLIHPFYLQHNCHINESGFGLGQVFGDTTTV